MTRMRWPVVAAACCTSLVTLSVRALFGLTRMATIDAFGTTSRNSPSCFAPSWPVKTLTPVIFPPGRFRLMTKPDLTGSSPLVNTIGIVLVAVLAASAAGGPPPTITATLRRIKSAASSASRSYTIRPAILYGDVAALDVPGFVQALAEGGREMFERGG